MDHLQTQSFPANSTPVTARDVLQILRRRWLLALSTFLVVVVGTAALTAQMKPVYEAKARVLLQDRPAGTASGNVLELLTGSGNGGRSLETQMEILRSRAILTEVIQKAKLETIPEELGGRLILAPGPGGELLDISVRARKPDEAARTADAFAHIFIEYVRQSKDRANRDIAAKTVNALAKTRRDKEAAQAALDAFYRQTGTTDPEGAIRARAAQVSQTRATLDGIRRDLDVERRRRAAYENLASGSKPVPSTIVSGSTLEKNPKIQDLQGRLIELAGERQTKLEDYQEGSLTIQDVDNRIKATQEQLRTALRVAYDPGSKVIARNPDFQTAVSGAINSGVAIAALEASERSSSALAERLVGEQKRMTTELSRFEELRRRRDSAVNEYQAIASSLTKVQLQRLTASPNMSILEPPRIPNVPISPRPVLNGILAVGLGLLLSIGTALLAEYFAGTGGQDASGGDAATLALGLPQVGGVPLLGTVGATALPGPIGADAGSDDRLPVPLSDVARTEDVFREIGFGLVSHAQKGTVPVVVLVGGRTDDAAASVAAQMAATLVRDGLRVTLVDADRAHPRLNRVFGAPDAPGLADVLAGRARVADILHVGADGHLRFLSAGAPSDQEPATERGYRALFKDLASGTDLVIVSGPSVFSIPAVAPLQRAADGLILVAPGDVPPVESVARARRLLTNGHTPNLLGVVVSAVPEEENVR